MMALWMSCGGPAASRSPDPTTTTEPALVDQRIGQIWRGEGGILAAAFAWHGKEARRERLVQPQRHRCHVQQQTRDLFCWHITGQRDRIQPCAADRGIEQQLLR